MYLPYPLNYTIFAIIRQGKVDGYFFHALVKIDEFSSFFCERISLKFQHFIDIVERMVYNGVKVFLVIRVPRFFREYQSRKVSRKNSKEVQVCP